jgi:hypothetical protein
VRYIARRAAPRKRGSGARALRHLNSGLQEPTQSRPYFRVKASFLAEIHGQAVVFDRWG